MQLILFMGFMTLISIALIILAAISLTKIKENMTEGDAKFATVVPPLAFGWLIGLIIYHASTKKKLEHNPELAKAGSTGNIIGIVSSIVYGIVILIATFTIAATTDFKIDKTTNSSISQNQEEVSNLKTFEATSFSIKMECAGTIQKQNRAEISTIIGTCVDINNGNYIAAETIAPEDANIDILDESQVDLLLNSTIDGFLQGSNGTELSRKKIGPTDYLVEGTVAGQDMVMQFSVKETAVGTVVYQLGINGLEKVDRAKFNDFINSFKLN